MWDSIKQNVIEHHTGKHFSQSIVYLCFIQLPHCAVQLSRSHHRNNTPALELIVRGTVWSRAQCPEYYELTGYLVQFPLAHSQHVSLFQPTCFHETASLSELIYLLIKLSYLSLKEPNETCHIVFVLTTVPLQVLLNDIVALLTDGHMKTTQWERVTWHKFGKCML